VVTVAIVLWNTAYLERATHALHGNGHSIGLGAGGCTSHAVCVFPAITHRFLRTEARDSTSRTSPLKKV
jgi:hypothetical protein